MTTVRRLAFLGVGSAVILGLGVMSAAPAFADNGPHYTTAGNTTVDRCAGCHRAHTAQDAYLLKTAQTNLCETCHNGSGATTDVVDGKLSTGGALRGGGFTYALIDTASGVNRTSIGVLSKPAATTSTHDVGVVGTAWGGGATGSGTSITLECGSCHDPHGNGNYRILRPVPNDAAGISFPSPVAVTSVTQTSIEPTSHGTNYYYAVVLAASGTFKVTNPVTFYGTTGGADAIIAATVSAVTDSTHLTVSSRTNVTTTSTGGTLGYANPQSIAGVSGDGTTATYKTWNVHGLVAGQKVTITGITPTGYNVTGATITAVPSSTTFQVANATTGAITTGGTISGIPDALAHVYTTTNYWAVDDHYYTNPTTPNLAVGKAPTTAFIASISQWCTQCHTRLLAGSGSYKTDSGDPMFTYEHRSNNGVEGSPNCIQCHVAHGTDAVMTGSGPYSSQVGTEITGKTGDSFLLRVDNRGTCNMCHSV